jgi:hypothetical protein
VPFLSCLPFSAAGSLDLVQKILRFTPSKVSELLTGSFSVHDLVSMLDVKVQEENRALLVRVDEILESGRKKREEREGKWAEQDREMEARHLAEIKSIREFHCFRVEGLVKALNDLDSPPSIADFEMETIEGDLDGDLDYQEVTNQAERRFLELTRGWERESDRLAEEREVREVRVGLLASFDPMKVRNAYMTNKTDVSTVLTYMINYKA